MLKSTSSLPAIGNISGGTANGVVYVNSSNVVTSGTSLTFDGTNLVSSGNVSAAALIPTGSTVPVSGMYLPSANTVSWATATTQRMTLDSSGNLSIGTASTTSKVHAYLASGTTSIRSESAGTTGSDLGQFVAVGGTYTAQFIQYGAGGAYAITNGTGLNVGTSSSSPLFFQTNNTIKATIDASGNFLARGVSLVAYKGATQNLSATTTLTNDSNLSVILAANGWYELDALIKFSATTNAAMGIKLAFTPNNAFTGSSITILGAVNATATTVVVPQAANATYNSANITTVATGDWLQIKGYVQVSATQTNVTFQFAQNTSNTNNLSVLLGSYVKFTQLS